MSTAQPKGQKATGRLTGTITRNDQPTAFNGTDHYIYKDNNELEIYSGEETPGGAWKSISLNLDPNITAGTHKLGSFSSFRSATVVPGNTDVLLNYSGILDIKPDHANRHYTGSISLSAKNNGSDTYQIEATFDLKE